MWVKASELDLGENYIKKNVGYFPKAYSLTKPKDVSLNSDWQNPDLAFTPDLNFNSVVGDFNFKNSAILSKTDQVIESENQNHLNGSDSASNKDFLPEEENKISSSESFVATTSTSTMSAFALDIEKTDLQATSIDDQILIPEQKNSEATTSKVSDLENFETKAEIENNESVETNLGPKKEEVLPRSSNLDFSDFQTAEAASTTPEAKFLRAYTLKVSLSGKVLNPGYLQFQIQTKNSDWRELGKINLLNEFSNFNNSGFYNLEIPEGYFPDLNSSKIRLIYFGELQDSEKIYLDSIWLEALYYLPNPEPSNEELNLEAKARLINPENFLHTDVYNENLNVSMPGDLENPISINLNGKKNSPKLKMLLLGALASTTAERQGDVIRYKGAYNSTDVEYEISKTGMKESIILKDLSAPSQFKYSLNLNEYDVVQVSPSRIFLYKIGHKNDPLYLLYTLSAPIMTDSTGKTSDAVSMEMSKSILTVFADADWLKTASYPVVVDPSVEITVLNVHSHPVTGQNWDVDFTTVGTADLTITPADQATVDDMQFESLTCDGVSVTPQILSGDVIFYPNWSCEGIARVTHLDLNTGHHHLIFNFGDAQADAYNAAISWTGGAGTSVWETGANWSSGTAPTSTDDVVINSATTVNVNASTTIKSLTLGNSGGTIAAVLNFNYDAASSGPMTLTNDLIVYSAASLTHSVATAGAVVGGKIKMVIGGSATVTGSITASFKGYRGGEGAGAGPTAIYAGGGSHGGNGGNAGQIGLGATSSYGSITNPTDLGSGGGNDVSAGANSGGLGGGAIILNVTGTTTVSGTIVANGGNGQQCYESGGGAGGSINITTGVLAGNGSITANGGNGCFYGGGGGGGRIAINYTSSTSAATITTFGGTGSGGSSFGGAGTVLIKSGSQTYGSLTVDNNNQGGSTESTFVLTPIASGTFDSILIKNSASTYLTASTASTTLLTISNNGLYDARSGTTLSYGSLTWSANLMDSGGTFAAFAENQNLTVPSGGKLIFNSASSTRTYNDVTVNGTLTHNYNNSATSGTASLIKINYTINGNLTVGGSGSINVDGKGYTSATGLGSAPSAANAGGGSYAGYGGNGATAGTGLGATTTYGSAANPTDLGSGGGNDSDYGANSGGLGGGAIILNVTGTTTISGTISAKGTTGQQCFNSGAGSGGSINITTVGLVGSGSVSVVGGTGCSFAGGGGGGRIAVRYTSDSSSLTYSTYGGAGSFGSLYGGSGTLYKKSAAQTYGDVTIDNNNQGTTVDTTFVYSEFPSGQNFDTVTIKNSAAAFLNASSATTTTLTLSNNGLYDARSGTTLAYTTFNWAGIVYDSGGNFSAINQNQDLSIPYGSKLLFNSVNASRTYNNLTVAGTLTHAANSSATTGTASLYKLNWLISGDLTVTASGTIDVSGKGYFDTRGTGGAASSTKAGGGAYGGAGGSGGTSSGSLVTYGSLTNPVDLGSSGGDDTEYGANSGGPGGGAIILNVTGTTTIAGTLNANGLIGLQCYNSGGGAGGSINLTTGVLAGAGSITANGGVGCFDGGGGGGGRIALNYTSDTHSGTRSVSGGTATGAGTAGSAGTINTNRLPNVPSTLGPSTYTTGSWTKVNQPGLTFSISDPDLSDTIKYELQISTSSSFSSYVVDYLSALGAQGSYSFTVGQAAGSGSYLTGSVSQTLVDSSGYYWRISAIDNTNATSSYTTANSGAIAFKVDTVVPTAGTISFGTVTANTANVVVSSASDALSGLAASPYNFNNVTSNTFSGLTSSNNITFNSLTPNTQYTFRVVTLDAASNQATSATSSIYTLSAVPTGPTVTLTASGTLTATWGENSNPFGTEYFAENITSSTNSGWITATTSVFSGLACGTSYSFRVKSRNVNLTESAYSSTVAQATQSCNATPNTPTSLGPPTLVDGSWRTTNQPTFSFYLSDSDAGDTLKFEIQISTTSNFSTLAVDYVSELAAQGARAFTVGQAVGSGSYLTGSSGQTLPDSSSYYWRVSNIDSTNATSSYAAANSGAIAFKIDTTPPSLGSVSFGTITSTSIIVNVSGFSDSGSGLSITPYIFYNVGVNNSTPTSLTTWTSSGLTPNTSYTFEVKVYDVAGNFITSSQYTTSTDSGSGGGGSGGSSSGGGGGSSSTGGGVVYSPVPSSNLNSSNQNNTQNSNPPINQQNTNTSNPQNSNQSQGQNYTSLFVGNNTSSTPGSISGSGGEGTQNSNSQNSSSGIIPAENQQPVPFTNNQENTTTPKPPLVSLPEFHLPEIPVAKILEQAGRVAEKVIKTGGETAEKIYDFGRSSVKISLEKTSDFTTARINTFKKSQAKVNFSAMAFAPTALALQYSIATNGLIIPAVGFADAWLGLLGFIQGILTSLGLRKRRRYWGTVYDSMTKQPLDPAIVELIDPDTGMVIQQSITDLLGRFGFLDKPGKYYIRAKKTHYSFPSKEISGSGDGIFQDLYHGEILSLNPSQSLLTPNIPMDPLEFDWNQQDKLRLIKIHPKIELAILRFLQISFWLGFATVIFSTLTQTTPLNIVFSLVYFGLAILRKFIPHAHLWGRVSSRQHPLGGLYLELSPIQIQSVVLAKTITSPEGKFFIKAKPGEYVLKIKKIINDSALLITSQNVKVGKDGVLNQEISLD